jgi:hypothetical protein
VTEEKDLKSKMIVNDSEGDDTTREKEKREVVVVGAATGLYGRPRTISSIGTPHARI